MKYEKVKDKYDIYTCEEFEELVCESLPNSFRYINYYRNIIMRLIKTVESLTKENEYLGCVCHGCHLRIENNRLQKEIDKLMKQ